MQTEINYKQLGKRIVEKRKEKNLLQKDFADMLGVAVNHLSDVERGVKRPSLDLLMKISCALNTPVDYFIKDMPNACCDYIINGELAIILEQFTPRSLKLIQKMAQEILEYQNSALSIEE